MTTKLLIDRFLSWPLPESLCSDPCASMPGYPHRTGTNLMTAEQAKVMLEYVLAAPRQPEGESEGLEVVAWQDADNPLYTTGERRQMHGWATDDYPIVELCRLSDAKRAIAERDAEILEQCRLNGMGAERELKLMAQRDKLAWLLLGLKVSVRDRAAGRAILADDVYELIDAAIAELTP